MTTEETKQVAVEIANLMKAMNPSEREIVLEAIKDLFCIRCGGDYDPGTRSCWCDYDSPLEPID